MSVDPKVGSNDDQIVERFRESAIQYSKCGFNTIKANRIMDKELRSVYETLKGRGEPALRKLLPLLGDENSTVQWVAAGFAYEVEPDTCRRVLEEVMQQRGVAGLMAWVTLASKNLDAPPAFPDW